MEKYFNLNIADEVQDDVPPHLKRSKIVALLKKEFNFENSHLRFTSEKGNGLLSKCFSYNAPDLAKDLGIYPFFREIEETDGAWVTINGKKVLTVSTNNYLGLTQDLRVIRAGQDALARFGAGCTGSRFLNGTFSLHNNLEKELSRFLSREDTIVMSTGFQANQGTIACLLGRKYIAFSDLENHASIYE